MDNESDKPQIQSAHVTTCDLIVTLDDGRRITTPLDRYPRLAVAPDAERQHLEVSPFGVHWPSLDEDIGLSGLLRDDSAPAI